MRRCGACKASNPDGAAWCGQCYAPLARAGSEPAQDAPTPQRTGPPRGRHAAPGEGPGHVAASTAFRQRDGEVEWACATCGLYNPLAATVCTACGTPMTAAFTPADAGRAGRAPDSRTVLAASLLLPGSGHVLAGHAATGIARALLYLVWLGGGLALSAAGGAPLVTVPLLLGAAAIWGGTVVDVLALAGDRPQVLRSRALLWLVVGVTLLSLLGLAGGVAGLA